MNVQAKRKGLLVAWVVCLGVFLAGMLLFYVWLTKKPEIALFYKQGGKFMDRLTIAAAGLFLVIGLVGFVSLFKEKFKRTGAAAVTMGLTALVGLALYGAFSGYAQVEKYLEMGTIGKKHVLANKFLSIANICLVFGLFLASYLSAFSAFSASLVAIRGHLRRFWIVGVGALALGAGFVLAGSLATQWPLLLGFGLGVVALVMASLGGEESSSRDGALLTTWGASLFTVLTAGSALFLYHTTLLNKSLDLADPAQQAQWISRYAEQSALSYGATWKLAGLVVGLGLLLSLLTSQKLRQTLAQGAGNALIAGLALAAVGGGIWKAQTRMGSLVDASLQPLSTFQRVSLPTVQGGSFIKAPDLVLQANGTLHAQGKSLTLKQLPTQPWLKAPTKRTIQMVADHRLPIKTMVSVAKTIASVRSPLRVSWVTVRKPSRLRQEDIPSRPALLRKMVRGATFPQYGAIRFTLRRDFNGLQQPFLGRKPLLLSVRVQKRGLTLHARGRKIPTGCKLSPQALTSQKNLLPPPTCKATASGLPLTCLHRCLQKLKRQFPENSRVYLYAGQPHRSPLTLGALLRVVDRIQRTKEHRPLFPEVVFAPVSHLPWLPKATAQTPPSKRQPAAR